MSVAVYEGLSSDRVRDPSGIDLDDMQCLICHNILWKAVSCQSCETPFCSSCIGTWLSTNPGKCPVKCDEYVERPCSRFLGKQLAKLQISCIYQQNGCQEIVPYEALEKHEAVCNYQMQQCPGCQASFLKKDFSQHEVECALIELTCQDCKTVYKQHDSASNHTDVMCLREQMRLLRQDYDQNKQQLAELRNSLSPVTITFSDIPNVSMAAGPFPDGYKNLKWTGLNYIYEQYAKRVFRNSGYATAFKVGVSDYVAFAESAASISVEDQNQVFDVISLEVCAANSDNVQLTMAGYQGGVPVNTHTWKLLFGKPQHIHLRWTNINMFTLQSSGGSQHRGSRSSGTFFLLTALRISGPH